jgi:hypothetical protein
VKLFFLPVFLDFLYSGSALEINAKPHNLFDSIKVVSLFIPTYHPRGVVYTLSLPISLSRTN